MKRFLTILSLGVIVSCYYFPFEFTFLPSGLNTKMILAAVGLVYMALNFLRTRKLACGKDLFMATTLAIVFSAWCFISINYNYTNDY